MTIGNHSTIDTSEICNSNSGSDSNSTNPHSAFRPLHEVKVKDEGTSTREDERQNTGSPVPSIAVTPLSSNKHCSHKAKSGERWDTKKVCNICGKVLSRGDKLKNHIRTHTNTYPYHCDSCGQGFLRSEGLKVHTRIHTGERPYVCILCGKSYTRKDKLTRHAVVHTGERPFVCQHCGKSFTRKDKMQRHELIHRVDKPFTCSPCNLEFVRQDTLNMHLERKHPERLPYTLVHRSRSSSPTYHPQGLDLSNLIDSKSDIVKLTEDAAKAPSSATGRASANESCVSASSASIHNGAMLNGVTSYTPLYTGVTLQSSPSSSLLSSASLFTSSTLINNYSGPTFPGVTPVMSGSEHPHA
ncbi:hypothetical protein SK128_025323 [Halocaridina rubra]|uniref:C2H2-type domain-containing protein n=1 Tax=Halocaridina rubra TaxID=373956 RepID=A0AAN8X3Z4_HALRR